MLDELIAQQEQKLYDLAKEIIPNITMDDLLQPNDYPQLEMHPYFRHEEGILDGLKIAAAFIRAESGSRTFRDSHASAE